MYSVGHLKKSRMDLEDLILFYCSLKKTEEIISKFQYGLPVSTV